MPNRATDDDGEKLDHSSHPTGQTATTDLRAPGGGALEHPEGRRRAAVQPRDDAREPDAAPGGPPPAAPESGA